MSKTKLFQTNTNLFFIKLVQCFTERLQLATTRKYP